MAGCGLLHAAASEPLRSIFLKPPEEAKPRGYWVWPHGNFDYSTLRSELQEFKAKGLGGVDIFDLGVRDPRDVIPPGPGFMSPEQVDGIAFALEEAKRLGLKMGLIVASSWNAGGTWTPPEHAMMNLVSWSETNTGPLRYERVLPFPEVPDSFRKPYGKFPLEVTRDEQGLPKYRKEVALLAYPVDANGRVRDPSQVRNLTGQMDASGKLTFDMPEGRWVILRAVLVNFGQRLWLPSDRSQGQTMDHFSKEATRHHFKTIIDRLQKRTGPLKNTGLERLYLASYEANAGVIWTPGFENAFHKQNGYHIEPFIPALYGATIVDSDTTQRFLYDYRKTVSELFVNNLYREASRICRQHGLLLCSEAGGPGAPLHDVPTEELKSLGSVDVMRGEFWNGRTNQLTPDGFEELQIVKPIASAAHIYGHRIVEMEAFTSTIHWQEGPNTFRTLADRAFCEGMTRVVYHTMSHNLPEAGRPGWTYQAGTHIGTTLTWWDMSQPLHTYLARCSAMLMQGDFVADVAYYYGDDVPQFARPKHLRPDLGYGYDYDDLNTEVLLRAKVDSKGRLVLPSGMRYAVLVLPPGEARMDPAALTKLEQILKAGATVIGTKPTRTYGLAGYPEAEQKLQESANRLWGLGTGAIDVKVGRGRLIAGKTTRDVLASMGIGPDLDVQPDSAENAIDYIHRRTAGEEIYMLRNTSTEEVRFEAHFRAPKLHPELWDAVTGTMTPIASYRQTLTGTVVPVTLPPQGSVFVVLSQSAGPQITTVRREGRDLFPGRNGPTFTVSRDGKNALNFNAAEAGDYELEFRGGQTRRITVPESKAPVNIPGPWEVRFPYGWGTPAREVFSDLISWTESTNAGIRGFSGTAVYTSSFILNADHAGQTVLLDLGEVLETARVYLNGVEIGISAFTPRRLDVTGKLRAGDNHLVVEVANTWLNRLIVDDELPPAERKTHTNLNTGPTNRPWRDGQPKRSGLIGPVRLVFPKTVVLQN